jgi:hypothetical protein
MLLADMLICSISETCRHADMICSNPPIFFHTILAQNIYLSVGLKRNGDESQRLFYLDFWV